MRCVGACRIALVIPATASNRPSTSMPHSLRYSDERAIPRLAAACTRLPAASHNALDDGVSLDRLERGEGPARELVSAISGSNGPSGPDSGGSGLV